MKGQHTKKDSIGLYQGGAVTNAMLDKHRKQTRVRDLGADVVETLDSLHADFEDRQLAEAYLSTMKEY
jgi:hypothetical protein